MKNKKTASILLAGAVGLGGVFLGTGDASADHWIWGAWKSGSTTATCTHSELPQGGSAWRDSQNPEQARGLCIDCTDSSRGIFMIAECSAGTQWLNDWTFGTTTTYKECTGGGYVKGKQCGLAVR